MILPNLPTTIEEDEEISNCSADLSTYMNEMYSKFIMGVSPIVYVHRLRIEKAKELLKSDYGTLSDMAQSLGYPSIYDFSRDFKKHTGVAPSKYEGT